MQSTDDQSRLTTRGIVEDITRELTNADRGIMGTLVQLTLRPRVVVRSYLDGDRQRFVSPTRYLMLALSAAAVYIFAIEFWYGSSLNEFLGEYTRTNFLSSMEADLMERHATTPLSKENLTKLRAQNSMLASTMAASLGYVIQYISIVTLLSIPVAAFFLRAGYVLCRFTFAESLIASIYVLSHSTIISLVVLPISFIGTDAEGFVFWTSVGTLIGLAYATYGIHSVYTHRWWELLTVGAVCAGVFLLISVLSGALGFVSYSLIRFSDFFLGAGWSRYLHFASILLLAVAVIYLFVVLYRLRFSQQRNKLRLTLLAGGLGAFILFSLVFN